MGVPLATRSFIARPAPSGSGYTGIHVQFDGVPSHHLPLLLAAFQWRFARDLHALTCDLIDAVAIGWDELGTDLLDGAPHSVVQALPGGEHRPSRTLDVITPDGSPPVRMTVTEANADALDMHWGYILHPHGIEVISLLHEDIGPVVDWNTDPRSVFSDDPARWHSDAPPPVTAPAPPAPPRSGSPAAANSAGTLRRARSR
ncbi:hypothetical protein [Streptomyces sp. SAS_276]|uniref:hypothetical protein n=1 Tax=Streptomyces sp. SAS_276 TaxID=3412745 RepID=UPI00403C849F